jgi:hypothetical protein
MLVKQETRVKDFSDLAEVQQVFYKEIEELCKAYITNAERCIVFDHKCRKGGNAGCQNQQMQTGPLETAKLHEGRLPTTEVPSYGDMRKPFEVVHGDYTRTDAWRRLRALAKVPSWDKAYNFAPQLSSNEIEDLVANKRFMILNVWRNVDRKNALKRLPLACLDCQTVHDDDVFDWVPPQGSPRVCDGFTSHPDNYVPTTQCIEPMARHVWFYYPEMTFSEALMFKTFDSAADVTREGLARACFHTAFHNTATKPNDPDRHSCEVRVLVIMTREGTTK